MINNKVLLTIRKKITVFNETFSQIWGSRFLSSAEILGLWDHTSCSIKKLVMQWQRQKTNFPQEYHVYVYKHATTLSFQGHKNCCNTVQTYDNTHKYKLKIHSVVQNCNKTIEQNFSAKDNKYVVILMKTLQYT